MPLRVGPQKLAGGGSSLKGRAFPFPSTAVLPFGEIFQAVAGSTTTADTPAGKRALWVRREEHVDEERKDTTRKRQTSRRTRN